MSKQSSKKTARRRATSDQRLNNYLLLHYDALVLTGQRLLANSFSSFMTVMVIAVTLTLPASFYLLIKNVQQISAEFTIEHQISLFLKPTLDDGDGYKLAGTLEQKPGIETLTVIGKEMAMTEFKAYSGFGEALDALESNPLPVVIHIVPRAELDSAELESLVASLSALPEADFAQFDMQWIERLHAMIEIAELVVLLLSLLLSLAVLFIVGNTIRLELHKRHDEIVVTKLVGGVDAFIRRPFLYSGLWYGLFGGVLAWAIIMLSFQLLEAPVQRLSELYDSRFELRLMNGVEGAALIVASTLLGIIGAWMVVASNLRQINPE